MLRRHFRLHNCPQLIAASKNGKFPDQMNSKKNGTTIIARMQCVISNNLLNEGREVADDKLKAEFEDGELVEIKVTGELKSELFVR
jgi:hypothetical protein